MQPTPFHRWAPALAAAAALALGWAPAVAGPRLFNGFLNDPGNTTLVGSDMGTAQFVDDLAVANNVALFSFTLATAQQVRFDSRGYAAGGADPYFTLLRGTGGSATFLQSNYGQPVAGDFDLSFLLAVGDYTVALGTFANMSVAENNGAGRLADGFIGLGQAGSLGNSYYELVISDGSGGQQVPEPPGPVLLALVGALLAGRVSQASRARSSFDARH